MLAGGAALLCAAACSSDPEPTSQSRNEVPLYEPCAADSECAQLPDRAVRCECAGGDTTVCVEYAAIGEDCFDDSWCPKGAQCVATPGEGDQIRHTCARLPVEGESCVELPCAAGSACGTDLKCGPPVSRLQRCDEFDVEPCEKGYYCESGMCTRRSQPGGLCQQDKHCPNGNHCRMQADGSGYCRVGPGAKCDQDADCEAGLRCDSGVCKPTPPLKCSKE